MSHWEFTSPRNLRGALAASALAASLCLALGPLAAPSVARVLTVNDTARLTLTNPSGSGSTLLEEGRAIGTLPGTVRARLTVGAEVVTAGFTIYLHGGTISGHGSAKLNAGRGEFASFGGSLSVSHGSGHYAHASGRGGLFGTINRNTDNATVQVVGKLNL
jgi:hypothetical protein